MQKVRAMSNIIFYYTTDRYLITYINHRRWYKKNNYWLIIAKIHIDRCKVLNNKYCVLLMSWNKITQLLTHYEKQIIIVSWMHNAKHEYYTERSNANVGSRLISSSSERGGFNRSSINWASFYTLRRDCRCDHSYGKRPALAIIQLDLSRSFAFRSLILLVKWLFASV